MVYIPRRDTDLHGGCNQVHGMEWLGPKFNPCDLATQVLSACSGDNTYKQQWEYVNSFGPRSLSCSASRQDGGCCCSGLAYTLVSVCSACRNNTVQEIDRLPDLGTFREACAPETVDFTITSQTPDTHNKDIPLSNEIPTWAYIEIENDSKWNLDAARANATGRRSTEPPPASTVPPPPPTSTSSPTAKPPAKLPATGTIVGASLGSVFGLCILLFLAYLFKRIRGRRVRHDQRTPVDLTSEDDPECGEVSRPEHRIQAFALPNPSRIWPYPFDRMTRRHHPDAVRSYEPSKTDLSVMEQPRRERRERREERRREETREERRERKARRRQRTLTTANPAPSSTEDKEEALPPPVPPGTQVPLDPPASPNPPRPRGPRNPPCRRMTEPSASRPHVTPSPEPNSDQLAKDLAQLGGGTGQMHLPPKKKTRIARARARASSFAGTLTNTSSSGTGSTRSRSRSKEKRPSSSGYSALPVPPSQQYLRDLARHGTRRVDPMRPWRVMNASSTDDVP